MKAKCNEIKVGNRMRKDLGNIDSLALDIKETGLLQPIGVTKDYELVFGERRLEACKLLNYEEIEVVIIDSDKVLECEALENVSRKSFIMSERVEIRKVFKEKFMKEKTELMKKGIKIKKREDSSHFWREKLARLSGVSFDTAKKEDFIVAYKNKDIIDDVDSGKLSVNKAHNKIKEMKKKAKAQIDNKADDLPTKEPVDVEVKPAQVYDASYNIVLSDNYNNITFSKDLSGKICHYSKEIKMLPLTYIIDMITQGFKDYFIIEEKN